ncbi:MAG TPA: hypothetical protein VNN25_23025 [Thermoanaerobaculia bacterium]|nr:hypothetical protein [Thermoanaerobaculia bacterium]
MRKTKQSNAMRPAPIFRRCAFLLLVAFPLIAQDVTLMNRIRPLAGKDLACAAVYSSYKSGRPRLVVAGIDEGNFGDNGELLLIRLPDAASGRGVVLDRMRLEAGAMELSFIPLVDPKDIAVQLHLKHPPSGVTVRVVEGKLEQIADALAMPQNVADLDGDGIPEIITGFVGGAGECGMRGSPHILRWNGNEYADDGKRYAAMIEARVGAPVEELEFDARSITGDAAAPPRPYVLRLFPQRGVTRVDVTVDDEPVAAGERVLLESDCHTMTAKPSGRHGAAVFAFLEEQR